MLFLGISRKTKKSEEKLEKSIEKAENKKLSKKLKINTEKTESFI